MRRLRKTKIGKFPRLMWLLKMYCINVPSIHMPRVKIQEMSTPTPTPTVGVVNGHTHSSPYGYTPSAPLNITFLATFAFAPLLLSLTHRILSLVHLAIGLKHRTWYFTIVFVLGGLGYSSSITLLILRRIDWLRRSRRVSIRRNTRHLLYYSNLLPHFCSSILLRRFVSRYWHTVCS
jgi:hypothetical protein